MESHTDMLRWAFSNAKQLGLYKNKHHLNEGKGNVDLYSASSRAPLTRSDGSHSVTCEQHHIWLYLQAFHRRHHHAYTHSERMSSTYYSFIDPKKMHGWVGYVGWYIADGLLLGGHLYVMAQTRESSPVIDRRSNHCATQSYRNHTSCGWGSNCWNCSLQWSRIVRNRDTSSAPCKHVSSLRVLVPWKAFPRKSQY